MRVCMLVANPFTHDARVLKEAMSLRDRGWDVTIVATTAPGLPQHERAEDGLAVVRVPREPLLTTALRTLLAALARRRASGMQESASFAPSSDIRGVALHLRRALEALAVARFWRRSALAARRARPDLVIGHDLDALPGAAVAARSARVPFVYDAHELWVDMPGMLPMSPGGRQRWMTIERTFARRASLVTTVSDGIADRLRDRYSMPRPLVVRNVPWPARITSEGASLRERLGLEPDRLLVLVLGRVSRGRGIEECIEALGHLRHADLVLLGPAEDDYAAEICARAAAGAAAGRVHLLPPVPVAEVVATAAGADLGLVPYRRLSLNDDLALPNRLFEYLNAGLPVVCGQLSELKHMVETRGVGASCDTDDPRSIAVAIERVVSERHRMSERAATAARELNWDVEGARFVDAVERAARR